MEQGMEYPTKEEDADRSHHGDDAGQERQPKE